MHSARAMACSSSRMGLLPPAAAPARRSAPGAPAPFTSPWLRPRQVRLSHIVVHASSSDGDSEAPKQPAPGTPEARRRRRRGERSDAPQDFNIDLNPINLGRQSRRVFDDVWQQLQRIGNPAASRQIDDDAYRRAGAAGPWAGRAAMESGCHLHCCWCRQGGCPCCC